jgi:hypothetical protein
MMEQDKKLTELEEMRREWDDDSEDDTIAALAAGMDPDAHMNHGGIHSSPNLTPLEDRREQTLLQIMTAAGNVLTDADEIMHQEATHYLVEKELIDTLREAMRAYKDANEDYIGTVDGIDATPSTKEL